MKVVDALNCKTLCVISDLNGTIYSGDSGNLCVDVIHRLDKNRRRYGGRYRGIFNETTNIVSSCRVWRKKVKDVAEVLQYFAVTTLDWLDASLDTVRHAKIEKPTKEYLEILRSVPYVNYHVVTGAESKVTDLFVNNRIAEHIPNAKIEFNATIVEREGRYFTGDVKEPLWDSEQRAKRARELAFDEISIGIGDRRSNDLKMAQQTTKGYILTGPATAFRNGLEEGNTTHINKMDLPGEIKKFLKTDINEIPPRITSLNVAPVTIRRF